MRLHRTLLFGAGLGCFALNFATGCLSLGGSTTHVHENPDTERRVKSLEARVSNIEQAVLATSVHEAYDQSAPPPQ